MAKATKKKPKKRVRKSPEGWKKIDEDFVYFLKEKVAKLYSVKKITFKGFDHQPVGLSLLESGGGFNPRQVNKIGGKYVLDFLKEKYKKEIRLIIFTSGHGAKKINEAKKSVTISISFNDFKDLLKDLGDEIKKGRNSVVQARISQFFPKEFKEEEEKETTNKRLSEINLNDLDNDGHQAIGGFIKRYISLNADNDKVLKELQLDLVIQGKKKTLDQVIRKFDKHIANKDFSEKKWQKFLHEEVFFFLSNYVESIREANVNFGKTEEGAKKPDFVWIDLYGFLDVFEIKTPYTDILAKKKDDSHDNYYFSSGAAKAISQIEKYILFLERNVDGFQNYLSKQTKIPFSVLKPKAFLIIGRSKEFENSEEKKKDFRILRRLFKNIEFITFDELLDNLKNLSKKFEEENKN